MGCLLCARPAACEDEATRDDGEQKKQSLHGFHLYVTDARRS